VTNRIKEVKMGQFSLFVIEVGICLLASGLLLAALTPPLRRLLIDACGTVERANFWVVYSAAMMFIVPLLAIVVLGKSTDSVGATLVFYKVALGSALLGLFAALAVLGIQIASLLPRRALGGKEHGAP
jgi:uncharacterized membrane protein YhaH (DUF805 family)